MKYRNILLKYNAYFQKAIFSQGKYKTLYFTAKLLYFTAKGTASQTFRNKTKNLFFFFKTNLNLIKKSNSNEVE